MTIAKKMSGFPVSIFLRMEAAQDAALQKGLAIVDMGVGTPDLPPPQVAIDAMCHAARDPENYKYSLKSTKAFTDAGIEHYYNNFEVKLSRENITGVIGSQDTLAHLPLALLDPGDVVLLPNPGYPMFNTGPLLASAEIVHTPLHEESGYLPDFDSIPADVAHRAKLLFISYPANPLGKLAAPGFFEKVVHFAKKYDIFVIHDNAYGDLVFDGREPESFLNAKGAADVGVELYSLSKSFNLTGMRIAYAAGHPGMLTALTNIKSNIDYGAFFPAQHAAVAALAQADTFLPEQRRIYESRRNALIEGLAENGWVITPPEGTMFAWAKLPPAFATDSTKFVLDLLAGTGVSLVPGSSFDSLGEGHVRIALTKPENVLRESAAKIGEFIRG